MRNYIEYHKKLSVRLTFLNGYSWATGKNKYIKGSCMNKKTKSNFSHWLEHLYQEGAKDLIHNFSQYA
jgi:predicted Zn-dependent peptidase